VDEVALVFSAPETIASSFYSANDQWIFDLPSFAQRLGFGQRLFA